MILKPFSLNAVCPNSVYSQIFEKSLHICHLQCSHRTGDNYFEKETWTGKKKKVTAAAFSTLRLCHFWTKNAQTDPLSSDTKVRSSIIPISSKKYAENTQHSTWPIASAFSEKANWTGICGSILSWRLYIAAVTGVTDLAFAAQAVLPDDQRTLTPSGIFI